MKSHVRNKSRNVQVVEFGSILVTEMIKLLSFLAVIQDKHTIAELITFGFSVHVSLFEPHVVHL